MILSDIEQEKEGVKPTCKSVGTQLSVELIVHRSKNQSSFVFAVGKKKYKNSGSTSMSPSSQTQASQVVPLCQSQLSFEEHHGLDNR